MKKVMKRVLYCFLTLALMFSYVPASSFAADGLIDNVPAPKSTVFAPELITYSDVPTIENPGEENYVDIYLPDGDGPFPVILWIHAGGWSLLDKTYVLPRTVESLIGQGYAIVSAGYTLSKEGEPGYPQMMYDLKAAVRFLRANAEQYNLDTRFIAAMGESAGGHLSMLMGTTNGNSTYEDTSMGNAGYSSEVQAMVSYCGPSTFVAADNVESSDLMAEACVGAGASDATKIAASPLHQLTSSAPPLFLTHSPGDGTVPFANTTAMAIAYESTVGTPPTTVYYDNAGHTARAWYDTDDAIKDVSAFLNDLRPAPQTIAEPETGLFVLNPKALSPNYYQNIVGFRLTVELTEQGSIRSGATALNALTVSRGRHSADEFSFTDESKGARFPRYDGKAKELASFVDTPLNLGGAADFGDLYFGNSDSKVVFKEQSGLFGAANSGSVTVSYTNGKGLFTDNTNVLTVTGVCGKFEVTGVQWIFGKPGSRFSDDTTSPERTETVTHKDLSYVEGGGTAAQRLDIEIPKEGDGPFPVFLWIHGGAWSSNTKNTIYLYDTMDDLLAKGFAVVYVEYTLTTYGLSGDYTSYDFDTGYPQMINDVKAAVRFVRAHADEYNLDPDFIAAGGDSAGGHLSMLMGATNGNPDYEDLSMGNEEYSSDIQAMASYYGPSSLVSENDAAGADLLSLYCLGGKMVLSNGEIIGASAEIEKAASPYYQITADAPPLFLSHGSDDASVSIQHSEIMERRAKELSISVTTMFYESAQHAQRSVYDNRTAIDALSGFLTENLPRDTVQGAIKVTGGLVKGVDTDTDGVKLFKGIPYAAPPVDELRWKAPEPVIPWKGVIGDTFGPICPQPDTSSGGYTEEFYDEPYPEMSEDCLYLNVWAPEGADLKDLPVMVWIHGGGNAAGWGYEKEFDGEGIASRGVILVTINYRLSVFGFLAHPDLTAESPYGASGNYGVLDQIAALKWVNENIEKFGGDSDNVTVFGQSAGAIDISTLICSPMTEGLIDKVIFQSGGMMGASVPLATEEAKGTSFAASLGANSLEELRAIPAADLFQARQSFGGLAEVVVDGYVIPDAASNLVADGNYLDIPYMIGANEDDLIGYWFFGAGTTTLGDNQLRLGRSPVYGYQFTRDLPGGGGAYTTGAFHSSELWYIFETLGRCWRTFDEGDYVLSKQMADYWTNFAKTGDPNGTGLPAWAPYTEGNKNIQILGDGPNVAAAKAALTWDAIKGGNAALNNVVADLVLPTSGENGTTITWSSSNPAIGNDGIVTRPVYSAGDASGKLIATITKGSESITVEFDVTVPKLPNTDPATDPDGGDGGTTPGTGNTGGNTDLTKNPDGGNTDVLISSITLKESLMLGFGKSSALAVNYNPTNTTEKPSVAWSSSNAKVAMVDTSGNVTGKAEGKATITATISAKSGVFTATCEVTVAKPVNKVSTPLKTVYIKKGSSLVIPALAYSADGTVAKLTWASNNNSVVTVNASGKITAAKKKGTARITATALNGKSVTIKVNVVTKAKSLKKISIGGVPGSMKKGKTAQITVKLTPVSATNLKVTFKSSKPAVISVDKAGKLTAKKKGKAVITIKAGGKTATKTVSVK
jgi:para-nitrobenzyl esterase